MIGGRCHTTQGSDWKRGSLILDPVYDSEVIEFYPELGAVVHGTLEPQHVVSSRVQPFNHLQA